MKNKNLFSTFIKKGGLIVVSVHVRDYSAYQGQGRINFSYSFVYTPNSPSPLTVASEFDQSWSGPSPDGEGGTLPSEHRFIDEKHPHITPPTDIVVVLRLGEDGSFDPNYIASAYIKKDYTHHDHDLSPRQAKKIVEILKDLKEKKEIRWYCDRIIKTLEFQSEFEYVSSM